MSPATIKRKRRVAVAARLRVISHSPPRFESRAGKLRPADQEAAMDDDLSQFLAQRAPTAAHPLLGLTVLLVEDSRFASEAMRLLCLRSGARIRRADCLRSAQRHLQTYRPTVVIVDVGLPDGSGLDLIAELAGAVPRVPVILGTSGNPDMGDASRAAGADGFLEKPIDSLVIFQQAVLSALPAAARPRIIDIPDDDRVTPDPIALRDDLTLAARLLGGSPDPRAVSYAAQFLSGVARVAHDAPLASAAAGLMQRGPAPDAERLGRVAGMVQQRLAAGLGGF
jgi:CheY-like chemotaxis protein